MLLVFFGLAGVGKNFVARVIEDCAGFYFWDADNALTEEMQNAINMQQQFSKGMRDEFTLCLIKKIGELQETYPNICVTQGLYKKSNRTELSVCFPEAKLIHVVANYEIVNQRLAKRYKNNNWLQLFETSPPPAYFKKIAAHFEFPDGAEIHGTIVNNTDESSVNMQFNLLLQEWNFNPEETDLRREFLTR